MSIKEYADVLRFAIKMQIGYKEEEMERKTITATEEEIRFLDGVIFGLQIALEKIDASMFLAENFMEN